MKKNLIIVSVLVLAGCASEAQVKDYIRQHQIISKNNLSITFKGRAVKLNAEVANEHCSSYGKTAVPTFSNETTVTFECR
jgi:hypothetical protein